MPDNASLVLPSYGGSVIKRDSAAPSLVAKIALNGSSLRASGANDLRVDTTPPRINNTHGVRPIAELGTEGGTTYKAGDRLYFDISFDKPVVATSGVALRLNTGTTNSPVDAIYYSGSATDTLRFEYTVYENDDASDLEVYDLHGSPAGVITTGTSGYVRRASTSPTTDANLDLTV